MPSVQDLLALQQQQAGPQPGGIFGGLAGPNPQQAAWKAQAQMQTQAMNAMPYVLDPSKLSTDPAANKAMMYPNMLQEGGVPRVVAGGRNIGPDLARKAPGFDFSNIGSVDALAQALADKAGVSLEEAKKFLQQAMAGGKGSDGFTLDPRDPANASFFGGPSDQSATGRGVE